MLGGEPAFEDHLQRDQPAGLELPCTVDDPHATSTDLVEQLVARDDWGHALLARDAVHRRPVGFGPGEVVDRQRLVDLHLQPEPFGELGEGPRVVAWIGPFAQLLPDEDLVVQQPEEGLGVACDGGEIAGIRPHIDPFAGQPAATLVHAQDGDEVFEGQRRPPARRQEGSHVGPLAPGPDGLEGRDHRLVRGRAPSRSWAGLNHLHPTPRPNRAPGIPA